MELKNNLGYQFRGILSELDFDNLAFDKQQEILVKHEIYTEARLMKYVFTQQHIKICWLDDNFYSVPNRNLSGYEIEYRGVNYSINEVLLKDIFNHIESDIMGDDYVSENIQASQRKISILLSKLLTDKERLDFCISKYNEYYSEIENINEIIYFENIDEDVDLTWEQYVISEIRHNVDLVKKHLLSHYYYNTDFVPIFKNWRVLHLSTEMMNFLKAKMIEYQSESAIFKNIDLSFQLAIIEKIMKIEDWDDISANKKGKILTHLLGKNADNIKDYYIELGKKPSDTNGKFFDKSGKYQTDKLKAEKIVNELLG